MEDKYGKRFPRETFTEKLLWMDVLTISDIFSFTPDHFVDECSYRDETGDDIVHSSPYNCTVFNQRKYVTQQYICYQLYTKDEKLIKFDSIHSSLLFDKMIYEIRFSGQLSESIKIRTTINDEGYPDISRKFAPGYHKKRGKDIAIMISCQNFTNYKLGYPYDRNYCQEGGENFFQCIYDCYENVTLKNIGRLPYTSFYDEPMDKKLISHSMLGNLTLSKLLQQWFENCEKSCVTRLCSYSYCSTVGHSDTPVNIDDSKLGSTIRVESPSSPDTNTTYIPFLPSLDFVIYILSTLGTWFGLVIISCNPVNFIHKVTDTFNSRMEWRRRRQERMQILQRRMNRRMRLIKF